MIICFEGPSAIGKTTLCKKLKTDFSIIAVEFINYEEIEKTQKQVVECIKNISTQASKKDENTLLQIDDWLKNNAPTNFMLIDGKPHGDMEAIKNSKRIWKDGMELSS